MLYNKYVHFKCLTSGLTYADTHYTFRVGVTTASMIVKQIDIATGFFTNRYFPNCLGAIDGKQARIMNPLHSGSMFYNYKNSFSIILMAVADSKFLFVYVDVGEYGRESYPSVFRHTSFGKKFKEGSLNLPPPERISVNTIPLPHVFIADEDFGLTTHLMRLYHMYSLLTKPSG
ncbi:hypothetical protein PR048_022727 [Dryococelus australis]|uniref:DDE Tnp4 domain-containing protein n=1 Tax=Dryococelus australis TaxID=614101 RepID=A0ABQ9GS34_9NEOP|nr:hypothetical protein PR048_022727 [Dryococelus australis]